VRTNNCSKTSRNGKGPRRPVPGTVDRIGAHGVESDVLGDQSKRGGQKLIYLHYNTMTTKVKECKACGQGFSEDNVPVGNRVPSARCANDLHEGPIERIVGMSFGDLHPATLHFNITF
jgi:hypothetical protein